VSERSAQPIHTAASGERRAVERVLVTFRTTFGPTIAGLHEGIVTDVTMHGCRLETPAPVPVNTYLELWLRASPTALRIVIELPPCDGWERGNLGANF